MLYRNLIITAFYVDLAVVRQLHFQRTQAKRERRNAKKKLMELTIYVTEIHSYQCMRKKH